MLAVQVGDAARVSLTVGTVDTAIAHESGNVPALSTPRVLALMEKAAAQAVAPSLDAADTTVGVSAELTHSVAIPIGGQVVAEARVAGLDGRNIDFDITVVDEATGKEVATGHHRRVVVDYARFVRRLTPETEPGH